MTSKRSKADSSSASRVGIDPILQFSQCNQNMLLALKEAGRFLSRPNSKTLRLDVSGLLHFLRVPVVCLDGCYFLDSPGRTEWRFVPDKHFPDRSGREFSDNKVHAEDIWGQGGKVASKPGIHNLVLGLILVDVLRMKLVCAYPAVPFRIWVSWHVTGIGDVELDRLNVRRDCCVGFHAARPGEDVLGDLERYDIEAVGVLAAGPSLDGQGHSRSSRLRIARE